MGNVRAQVSAFLIISILAAAIIAGAYLLRDSSSTNQGETVSDTALSEQFERLPIRNAIEACVDKTAMDGIALLGAQGGYLQLEPILSAYQTAYWYLDQVNVQPTLEEMRLRLESYLNTHLPSCVDFSSFRAQGFGIVSGAVQSAVSFNKEDVTVGIVYPVQVENNVQLSREERFTSTLDVRFRRIFEAASTLVNIQLDPRFDFTRPLALAPLGKFQVDVRPETDTLVYTLTDPQPTRWGTHMQMRFASRFQKSELDRSLRLHPGSNTQQLFFPLTLYSVDRLAELHLLPGTTVSLNSGPVQTLTVERQDLTEITRPNTPFIEHADDSVTYGDLTWQLTYPQYSFGPAGTRFNQPENLRIYWDEEKTPHVGNMGLLYQSGDVLRPIPCKVNYQEYYVEAQIIGFSEYVPIDCGVLGPKAVSAKAENKPSVPLCLVLSTLAIVSTVLDFITFGLIDPDFPAKLAGYRSEENCINFVPACDQTVSVYGDEKDGDGSCSLKEGANNVNGGNEIKFCAKIKKCDRMSRLLCKKCSMECSTSYV
ncbi:MAG: hypothetical protein Q7S65_06380 [Nanoarchaeota archaeon]|nr:hypothetical protein [Nanoarchaeota archaeon]